MLHCSFWADNFNRIIVHLNQRDVTMIAVSRAPYSKLTESPEADGLGFQMGFFLRYRFQFRLPRVIHTEELAKKEAFYDFVTQDPHSSEREGVSVFYKDPAGRVFHTYSALYAWHRYVECRVPLP